MPDVAEPNIQRLVGEDHHMTRETIYWRRQWRITRRKRSFICLRPILRNKVSELGVVNVQNLKCDF